MAKDKDKKKATPEKEPPSLFDNLDLFGAAPAAPESGEPDETPAPSAPLALAHEAQSPSDGAGTR